MEDQIAISRIKQGDLTGLEILVNRYQVQAVRAAYFVKVAERVQQFDEKGAYVVYAGEASARWNPDAPILRLRWIQNGIWFEMAKFGGVESIAYLDRAGLIALAESMR